MVSGLAPGNPALTEITGNSTCGSGATGRKLNARIPAMSKAAASSEVPIGRLMNGAEMFIANRLAPEPCRQLRALQLGCRFGSERSVVPADRTRDRQPELCKASMPG